MNPAPNLPTGPRTGRLPRAFAASLLLLLGGVMGASGAPIQATDLARELEASSPPSSLRYQNKSITVTGILDTLKISPNTGSRLALLKAPPKDNVMVRFAASATAATAALQPGQTITVQGFCRVFDGGVAIVESVLVPTPAEGAAPAAAAPARPPASLTGPDSGVVPPARVGRFERDYVSPMKSYSVELENVEGSRILIPRNRDSLGVYKVGPKSQFIVKIRQFASVPDADAAMPSLARFFNLPGEGSVAADLNRYQFARTLSVAGRQIQLYQSRPRYPKGILLLWQEAQHVYTIKDAFDAGSAWEEFLTAYLAPQP